MPFISALRGVKPANFEQGFPWKNGMEKVNADANLDGRVSFEEVAKWARKKDISTCPRCGEGAMCGNGDEGYEHPQYAESQSGLGASMFIPVRSKVSASDGGRGKSGEGGTKGEEIGPPAPEPYRLPIPKAAYKPEI